MVITTHNKLKGRERPHQREPPTASFERLPNELLLDLFEKLPTADILKVRQSCRAVVPACNHAIKTRLKRIYVHPSTTSLRSFLEIAQSGFGEKIEEVCLVGKIHWCNNLRIYPNMRKEPTRVRGQDCSPWPLQIPLPRGQKVADRAVQTITGRQQCQLGGQATAVKAAYQPLVDAIKGLEKFDKLSFVETCELPGFNCISEAQIESHARKYAAKPPSRTPSTGRGITDAKILFYIRRSFSIKVKTLSLSVDLPLVRNSILDHVNSARDMAQDLRCLDLFIPSGWVGTEWVSTWRSVLMLAKSLEELSITFGYNNAHSNRGATQQMLPDLLHDNNGDMPPKLRKLHFRVQPKCACPDSNCYEHRRPMCHDFDILAFLASCTNTLEELRIENVTFECTKFESPSSTIVDTIRALDAWTKNDAQKLRVFDWKINRFSHNHECSYPVTTAVVYASSSPIYLFYSQTSSPMVTLLDVDAVAKELGARYGEGGEYWVFDRVKHEEVDSASTPNTTNLARLGLPVWRVMQEWMFLRHLWGPCPRS